MSNDPIDGEIVYPEDNDQEPAGDNRRGDASFGQNFWDGNFEFPAPPFGELLIQIRARIGDRLGRAISQSEFGDLLGDVDQVTISRWQRGQQRPQVMQLEKIVALANQYDMKLTLARLQQSLDYDVKAYAVLDPRLKRLDALLVNEDDAFRDEFYEVVIGLLHMLKGVRRNRGL